jgi:hypothetical protein
MNLDHETTSTVVIVRLYLAIAIETMPWIKKYPFLCTSCEFKLLENSKWIVVRNYCCFETTMDKAKSLDAQQ